MPVQRCYPALTTHEWSGFWWVWWLLIALALLIFLLALILTIIICCLGLTSVYHICYVVAVNYLRQGGNVFAGFCLSVCLCVCVCEQDNSESYGRIFFEILKEYRAWHKLQVIQFRE